MQDSAGPHFVLGGVRRDASPNSQGAYGFYWSSLVSTSATNAYSLALNGTNSTVNPADYHSKRYGFTLRCLAQ